MSSHWGLSSPPLRWIILANDVVRSHVSPHGYLGIRSRQCLHGRLVFVDHYDGSAWTIGSHSLSDPGFSMWGSSATNIFTAGYQGFIAHFDGAKWSDMPAPQATIYTTCGAAVRRTFSPLARMAASSTLTERHGPRWIRGLPPTSRAYGAVPQGCFRSARMDNPALRRWSPSRVNHKNREHAQIPSIHRALTQHRTTRNPRKAECSPSRLREAHRLMFLTSTHLHSGSTGSGLCGTHTKMSHHRISMVKSVGAPRVNPTAADLMLKFQSSEFRP